MTKTPFLLTAVLAALALGACGSSGESANSGGDDDTAFEGALKFAQCMRDHGVDMPDPTRAADGGITMRVRSGTKPPKGETGPRKGEPLRSGKEKVAFDACKKYQVAGGRAPDPKKLAEARDRFVAYARCMRSKGIDMPDPKVTGGGLQMSMGGGIGPDTPKFKAADDVCHDLLGDLGAGGPRGTTEAKR